MTLSHTPSTLERSRSRYAVPANGIYLYDASPSLRAQVRGPLGGDSVQELLQIWQTARAIGPKLHLLSILRTAGVSPLWPDQDRRFEHTKP